MSQPSHRTVTTLWHLITPAPSRVRIPPPSNPLRTASTNSQGDIRGLTTAASPAPALHRHRGRRAAAGERGRAPRERSRAAGDAVREAGAPDAEGDRGVERRGAQEGGEGRRGCAGQRMVVGFRRFWPLIAH